MPDYPLGVLIKHIQIQIGKSLNHRLEQMNITGSQAHVLVFLMNLPKAPWGASSLVHSRRASIEMACSSTLWALSCNGLSSYS